MSTSGWHTTRVGAGIYDGTRQLAVVFDRHDRKVVATRMAAANALFDALREFALAYEWLQGHVPPETVAKALAALGSAEVREVNPAADAPSLDRIRRLMAPDAASYEANVVKVLCEVSYAERLAMAASDIADGLDPETTCRRYLVELANATMQACPNSGATRGG